MNSWDAARREIDRLSEEKGINHVFLIVRSGEILLSSDAEKKKPQFLEITDLVRKMTHALFSAGKIGVKRILMDAGSTTAYLRIINSLCALCAILDESYDLITTALSVDKTAYKIDIIFSGREAEKDTVVENRITRELLRIFRSGEIRKKIDDKMAKILFGT